MNEPVPSSDEVFYANYYAHHQEAEVDKADEYSKGGRKLQGTNRMYKVKKPILFEGNNLPTG